MIRFNMMLLIDVIVDSAFLTRDLHVFLFLLFLNETQLDASVVQLPWDQALLLEE